MDLVTLNNLSIAHYRDSPNSGHISIETGTYLRVFHYIDGQDLFWYTSLGYNSFSPVPLLLRNHPTRAHKARVIQRAYRAHLRRAWQAKALAFAMALHPRLGRGAPVGGLDPDLLILTLSHARLKIK